MARSPAYEHDSASLGPVHLSDPLGPADADDTTSALAVESESTEHNDDDHEPAERLAADQQLYEALKREGFQGPAWDRFVDMLARYGVQIIRAWVLTMRIFHESARKGVKGARGSGRGGRPFTVDDADQLADDTVAAAIRAFRDKVLFPGRWSPSGGASLRSFFIGQCLFAFPNAYRRWQRENQPLPELSLYDDDSVTGLLVDPADPSLTGDPAGLVEAVETRDEVLHALKDVVKNDRDQAMVVLRAAGYADREIADLLDQTEKAVEGVFYRLRKRVNAQAAPNPTERR
jgi:DNA-directed RNA polymerase specialized sigma24 family protein